MTALGILLARERIGALEADIRVRTAPVDIVVAAVPIAAGAAFSEGNLARTSVPSSGSSRRNVRAADFRVLLGSKARHEIGQGEPVLWSDAEGTEGDDRFSQTIPSGRRAVTIEADPSASFCGLIRTGDRVDIHYTLPGDRRESAWLVDVPVAAVNQRFKAVPGTDEPQEVSAITLSLTPEDGRRLALAGGAEMRWFLRNPEDRTGGAASGSGRNRRGKQVEIWKGGIRESGSPTRTASVELPPWP